MTIVEKAAYLKGLADGLGMDPQSRDGKLWNALNDLLGDIARKLEEHEAGLDAHEKTLDNVYEELIYLQETTLPEEELTDYDEDDYEDDEDDEDDDLLYKPSLRLYEGDGDEDLPEDNGEEEAEEPEDYDGILYDVTCPGCGETITFDEDTLDQGSIRCPNCGETLEFDLGDDGDDGDDGK